MIRTIRLWCVYRQSEKRILTFRKTKDEAESDRKRYFKDSVVVKLSGQYVQRRKK